MDYYINYILELLNNSPMDEDVIKSNLVKKFSLTDTYCSEILNIMIDKKLVVSEFDEDFHNIYTITNLGTSFMQSSEDYEEQENIDYKSLLGDMYEMPKKEDVEDNEISDKNSEFSNEKEFNNDANSTDIKNDEVINNQSVYVKDFSKYKINVKKHTKNSKYHALTKEYIRSSRLEFYISLALFIFFGLLEIISCVIIINLGYQSAQIDFTFTLYTILYAIYPISMLIYYLLNKYKKVRNNFNFSLSFKLILLCVSVLLLLIFALNFLFGLTSLNIIKYLPFWLFPSLIGISIIFYPVLKMILIKTNKFNA